VARGEVALAAGAAALAAAAAVSLGPAALGIPVALAIAAFLMREPLALLALYLSVGLFKEQAVLRGLPIDATLALGLLLAIVCGVRLVTGRVRAVPHFVALTIAVVSLSLVASLAWTSAPSYGGEKVTTFVTVTMLAIGAPFFLFERWDDLRRFFAWIVIIAVPVAVIAMANPSRDTGRLAGDNTIGTSRLLCTAALILVLGALASRSRWRLPAAGAATGFVAIAAAVGSRGPILSLALALVVVLAAWLLRVPRKIAPALAVAVVSLAAVPFLSLPETSRERLSSAARDPVAAFREDARYTLVQQASDLIESHPILGAGAGAFSTVSVAKWPHNLFLELWSELGLAALLVVAAAVIAVLVGLFRLAWRLPAGGREQGLVYILLAVFVFNLLAAQVSGDLNDNRDFWGMLALASLVVAGVSGARAASSR
jgi:O-antigen ligase